MNDLSYNIIIILIIMIILLQVAKDVWGLPASKDSGMVILIDDIALSTPDEYGVRPPLELLRTLIEQHGWYPDNPDNPLTE